MSLLSVMTLLQKILNFEEINYLPDFINLHVICTVCLENILVALSHTAITILYVRYVSVGSAKLCRRIVINYLIWKFEVIMHNSNDYHQCLCKVLELPAMLECARLGIKRLSNMRVKNGRNWFTDDLNSYSPVCKQNN